MSSEFRILKKVGVPKRSCSEFSFEKNRMKIRQILKKIVRGFLRVIFRQYTFVHSYYFKGIKVKSFEAGVKLIPLRVAVRENVF